MNQNENITLLPRHAEIIDVARQEGRVEVDKLARQLQVTPQTVRRDLNDLCRREILQRVHGGAIFPVVRNDLRYVERRGILADEKLRISKATAKMVPSGSSVLMNIGTTTERVAELLTARRDLLVITNNLNIAQNFAASPDIEVIVAGGSVRKSDNAIVGQSAVDMLRQFRVDLAIIGASAIAADGTLLDYDYQEVHVARAIIEQAAQTVLVADHSKFERRAPVRIAHVSDVQTIVTDRAVTAEFARLCADVETDIIVADQEVSDDGAG